MMEVCIYMWYTKVYTMRGGVVHVRFAHADLREIDRLVANGFYSSRSEAIKDFTRLGKEAFLDRQFKRALLASRGALKSRKSAVRLVREARDEIWEERLKKAGGSEAKALKALAKSFNQEI